MAKGDSNALSFSLIQRVKVGTGCVVEHVAYLDLSSKLRL
jgi:hypothetical protein